MEESERLIKDEEGGQSLDSMVTLKDIQLNIKKGEFVCVIGDVASGKSSLLSTIIGDLIPITQKQLQNHFDLSESGFNQSVTDEKAQDFFDDLLKDIAKN